MLFVAMLAAFMSTISTIINFGSSYFVNPRGQKVAQASDDKDELVIADLDFDMVREVRNTWQFFRDRRPESYGQLTEL